MIADDYVLYRGRPYMIASVRDSAGFCFISDVEGETIMVHESEIDHNDWFIALMAWLAAEISN